MKRILETLTVLMIMFCASGCDKSGQVSQGASAQIWKTVDALLPNSRLDGNYSAGQNNIDKVALIFNSGGTVRVFGNGISPALRGIEMPYEVQGNKVNITAPKANLVMTLLDDGDLLYSGYRFKKEDASTIPSPPVYSIKDGEVYDPKTNLTWQRCTVGQQWQQGFGCNGSITPYDFNGAHKLETGNWRLPTKDELETLIDKARKAHFQFPPIDVLAFPSMDLQEHPGYWTNTPDGASSAWVVGFREGDVLSLGRRFAIAVRLVRSGQEVVPSAPQQQQQNEALPAANNVTQVAQQRYKTSRLIHPFNW